MSSFLKKLNSKTTETKSKKKVENLIFLIVILIITLLIINTIWKQDDKKNNEQSEKTVFNQVIADKADETSKGELEAKLENILSTIKNVGDVSVFINYAESSKLEPLYDETTTTSSTEEGDSSGGTRNVTETETQKDVVFSESSGSKEPITQKTTMPVIQGAIVTAKGANDPKTKTNIINAVEAVTGLTIDKIQVFEKEQ